MQKRSSFLKEWLPYIIFLAVIILIRVFILINAVIPTESMVPTIQEQDRVFGLKCSYWFNEPRKGDIIVFIPPDRPDILYIKRVIGTPGDTVEIRDGHVYVNGEQLEEDYLNEPMIPEDPVTYQVPEDSVFVLGDNRNYSGDSRRWISTPYVTYDKIIGKAYVKYWPSFGILQ